MKQITRSLGGTWMCGWTRGTRTRGRNYTTAEASPAQRVKV